MIFRPILCRIIDDAYCSFVPHLEWLGLRSILVLLLRLGVIIVPSTSQPNTKFIPFLHNINTTFIMRTIVFRSCWITTQVIYYMRRITWLEAATIWSVDEKRIWIHVNSCHGILFAIEKGFTLLFSMMLKGISGSIPESSRVFLDMTVKIDAKILNTVRQVLSVTLLIMLIKCRYKWKRLQKPSKHFERYLFLV